MTSEVGFDLNWVIIILKSLQLLLNEIFVGGLLQVEIFIVPVAPEQFGPKILNNRFR